MSPSAPESPIPHERYLLWGGHGWIGSKVHVLLVEKGKEVHLTSVRIECREKVLETLEQVQPTHVINCAGITGTPNVDWCEDHRAETLRANVIGALNLADCCAIKMIHHTVFTTGCVYTDRAAESPSQGWKEEHVPNYKGSFYSETKGYLDQMLRTYNNCLILRLRMPVSDDMHPRSLVTKLLSYERVVISNNSQSILHDMLPAGLLLMEHGELGVYNLTNPGSISHQDVLNMFKASIRPGLTWKTMTRREQDEVLKAGRSECSLDTRKLEAKLKEYGASVPEISVAYSNLFGRMKEAGVE